MPARKAFVPKYCLHKPSGKAYCRIHGKVIYLGDYDSPESKKEYARVIAEHSAQPTIPISKSGGMTVVEVSAAFLDHADTYYRKDGKPTGHIQSIRPALRVLIELYGHTLATDFGPLALRAVQEKMVEKGHCRTYVNQNCDVIKRMFKWAVSMEMLPATVYQALSTVPGLRKGRTEARESEPVLPVDDELVDATLPFLSAVVADMVRVHRLIGCRPGDLCMMRPCDIDRSDDVWVHWPESHKSQHHSRDRAICIGPKAQAILQPYLGRDPNKYCFSPAENVERQRALAHTRRKTPIKYGNRPGTNRRKNPKRAPRAYYDKNSYNNAIRRATTKANNARIEEAADMGIKPILLPHWHANQLRHSAATRIRREFGLEAAQVILGHANADVTQVYAERDSALAIEVSRKIG